MIIRRIMSEARKISPMLIVVVGMLIMTSLAAAATINRVSVTGGEVRGTATDLPGVILFKGIPFAGSAAGPNRWTAPQPVMQWEDIKVCDKWGDEEVQTVPNPGTFYWDEFRYDPAYEPPMSEACLNLNVYTPANSPSQKLGVLVFIHGGGNTRGCASNIEFNASRLAQKGIIVVTVQYRLGLFGFLALEELSKESPHGVSGNYAVLDLVEALKWVKANIAGFGGDPQSITIAGQSAGAYNVTALLRTPLAKGLFKRVIIQSGFEGLLANKNTPVYIPLKEKEAACKAAVTAAFGKDMSVAELRAISPDELLTRKTPDGKLTIFDAITNAAIANNLGYTLDGYVFTEESVDLMRNGALDGIDVIIGGTSDEYTSLIGGDSKTMPMNAFSASMKKTYGDEYNSVYKPTSELEAYRLFLRSMSDLAFQKYLLSAEYVKAHNNANAYVYYFNHAYLGRNQAFYGSYHSAELWYFFDSMRDKAGQRAWTPDDYNMADMISGYIANFVKSGNPNSKGMPEWKQCTAANNASFMRWAETTSECVTNTPMPERDKLNRDKVMSLYEISDIGSR